MSVKQWRCVGGDKNTYAEKSAVCSGSSKKNHIVEKFNILKLFLWKTWFSKKQKQLLNGFTIYDDEAYLVFCGCSSTINVFRGKQGGI